MERHSSHPRGRSARSSRLFVAGQQSERDGVYHPFCYAGGDNKSFAAMGGRREKESAFPTRCTFPFGGTQGGESVLRKGECSFWVSVGKPPNLRAWGIMKRSDIRKSKKGCGTHQWWFAREVRACSLPGSIAKETACTVPFAMLVETTRLELVTSTETTRLELVTSTMST